MLSRILSWVTPKSFSRRPLFFKKLLTQNFHYYMYIYWKLTSLDRLEIERTNELIVSALYSGIWLSGLSEQSKDPRLSRVLSFESCSKWFEFPQFSKSLNCFENIRSHITTIVSSDLRHSKQHFCVLFLTVNNFLRNTEKRLEPFGRYSEQCCWQHMLSSRWMEQPLP